MTTFEPGKPNEFFEMLGGVPLNNSEFQITKIILSDPFPHRQYRQAILEMKRTYEALAECSFRRRKLAVELKKAQKKIADETDQDEKELLQIEIDEKNYNLAIEDKMILDAITEYNLYLAFAKSLLEKNPKLATRAVFEAMEPAHWQQRALHQAEMDVQTMGRITQGNIDLLLKVGLDPDATLMQFTALLEEKRAYIVEQQEKQIAAPQKNATDASVV